MKSLSTGEVDGLHGPADRPRLTIGPAQAGSINAHYKRGARRDLGVER